MTQLNRRQITDRLRTFAQNRNIVPDLARKYFMLERVLERLSKSDYRENFIIKGGFLIGSLIGMENRTTKDIDATITGIQLEQEQLLSVFNDIFQDDSVDNIKFSLTKIHEIREEEFYYRNGSSEERSGYSKMGGNETKAEVVVRKIEKTGTKAEVIVRKSEKLKQKPKLLFEKSRN